MELTASNIRAIARECEVPDVGGLAMLRLKRTAMSNGLGFDGLREQDVCAGRGDTFVMLAAGLVHPGPRRCLQSRVCRSRAASIRPKRPKAERREDGSWHASCAPKAAVTMVQALGVDVRGDLGRLHIDTFGTEGFRCDR